VLVLVINNIIQGIIENLLQFGGSEAEKPRMDTFAAADRSYEVDQKSTSSRDGSVANGVGLNSANNFR